MRRGCPRSTMNVVWDWGGAMSRLQNFGVEILCFGAFCFLSECCKKKQLGCINPDRAKN